MKLQLVEMTEENRKLVTGVTETAIQRFDLDTDSPDAAIAQIGQLVVQAQRDATALQKLAPNEDGSVLLGVAWGEQLRLAFGWAWKQIGKSGERVANPLLAVAAPDQSMAIFPIDYVRAYLDTPAADCCIELSYNMIKTKSHPLFSAGDLVDFMEGVRRVVPR
ncbi:hypothetical protein [Rhodopirellula bahusiensis]|uniref:DUF3806 domain-containing protein n=1 Tax=Rhodopirellula bahusiensis TaxID=2014065 RepID=A0A2G1W2A5_9BACT|nr:hypothetical protein [Rhodopirellula bahusiensis]PHQ33168.1 hypothetical protein CEE69_22160 [Rhodopirellula bahusiensis]